MGLAVTAGLIWLMTAQLLVVVVLSPCYTAPSVSYSAHPSRANGMVCFVSGEEAAVSSHRHRVHRIERSMFLASPV